MRPLAPILTLILLAPAFGCNTAPVEYLTDEKAPGAHGPLDQPTNEACDQLGSPTDPWIDGFQLCRQENNIIPVDDPIMYVCADADIHPDEEMFWVFDGVRARAYPILIMEGRELLNENFGGTPLLVDW